MFDFNRESPSSYQCIFCVLLYLSFFLLTFNDYFRLNRIRVVNRKRANILVCIFAVIITLTYFLDTDYFHYYQTIQKLSKGYTISTIEGIYPFIAKCTGFYYLPFRLIVWGSALLVFYKLCKKNKISGDLGIYVLMIMYGNLFSYARASLAMSILFYGFGTFLVNNHIRKKFFGIIIMCLSVFFHTSIVVALLCCLLALVIKWKKSTIVVFLSLLPLVALALRLSIGHLLNSGGMEGLFIDKLIYYSELENITERTIFGKIQNFLEISSFVLPLVIIGKRMYFHKNPNNCRLECNVELRCFQCAFFIILLSIAFNFIGLGTEVFSYRIRYMAMIPIVISLLGLFSKNYLRKNHLQICIILGFSSISMVLLSALKGAL